MSGRQRVNEPGAQEEVASEEHPPPICTRWVTVLRWEAAAATREGAPSRGAGGGGSTHADMEVIPGENGMEAGGQENLWARERSHRKVQKVKV